MELVIKREFSDEKRKQLAAAGHALPDGSFPIENVTDLHNAIQSVGRAKNYSKVRAHIIARAKALGATSILPDDWKVTKFFEDVKDAFEKAIGTSSSVDQERDERTVENYVRGNFNTNVDNIPGDYTIGGTTMSNQTTEPDPKGNIAVTKDLPDATRAASATIDQATRPEGDVSVSDAPNNDALPEQVATDGAGIYKSGMTCPDCGGAVMHECWGDSSDVNKAAAADEVTEDNANDEAVTKAEDSDNDVDAVSHQAKQMNKSIWGGAFAPRTNIK